MQLAKVNKVLFGWLPVSIQEELGMLRRYSFRGREGNGNPVIAMVDGSTFHGGLCDRWKGIVSLYALSKVEGRAFKIHYTYPFRLEHFQEPSTYDWSIADEDVSNKLGRVSMLRLTGDPTLKRVLQLPLDKQIHAYANRDWVDVINHHYGSQFTWGGLYKELFKPSPLLQAALQAFPQKDYVAVALRMQNLLGDYPEYHYQPADKTRQEIILRSCVEYIQQLHELEPHRAILVTSDSARMSMEASRLPYVFTNHGVAAHVDTIAHADEGQYGKSFIDFYLLSGAKKVYAVTTREMYHSDFPRYAALLNNCPFERISLS